MFRKGRAEGWGRGGEKLSLRLQPQGSSTGRKALPVSFKKSQIRCGETQKMLAPQTHPTRSRLGSARSSAPWRRPRVDTRSLGPIGLVPRLFFCLWPFLGFFQFRAGIGPWDRVSISESGWPRLEMRCLQDRNHAALRPSTREMPRPLGASFLPALMSRLPGLRAPLLVLGSRRSSTSQKKSLFTSSWSAVCRGSGRHRLSRAEVARALLGAPWPRLIFPRPWGMVPLWPSGFKFRPQHPAST